MGEDERERERERRHTFIVTTQQQTSSTIVSRHQCNARRRQHSSFRTPHTHSKTTFSMSHDSFVTFPLTPSSHRAPVRLRTIGNESNGGNDAHRFEQGERDIQSVLRSGESLRTATGRSAIPCSVCYAHFFHLRCIVREEKPLMTILSRHLDEEEERKQIYTLHHRIRMHSMPIRTQQRRA